MKKRHTEEHIIKAIKKHEAGAKAEGICREMGISMGTFYNCHWFDSLPEAKLKIEAWRDDYNKSRPHRALNNLPPLQFVASIDY